MKTILKKSKLICLAFTSAIGYSGMSQSFTETIGTVSGTTAIAVHESNNGFSNSSFVMSGSADIRITSSSTSYLGASGGANVFFTNNGASSFLISGINTSNLGGISLSFGCAKSTTSSNGSDFIVEVSSDGTTYQPLNFPSFSTGSGTAVWRLVMASGNIPSVANLRLRFRNTSTVTQYRIDDIKLSAETASPSCEASINSQGGFNYICFGQSLQLVATSGAEYNWSTGATTQSIMVSTPGIYSVQVTNALGCVSSANITLSQSPNINASITSSVQDATLCTSGGNAATTLTAAVTGGNTINYNWQYQDNFGNYQNIVNGSGTSPFIASQNASPSTTRNYRIKITDSSFPNCSYFATQLVTVIPDPTILLNTTNPSCSNLNDGTLVANIVGGTQNNTYNFSWSSSNSTLTGTNQISGLAAGNYTLNILGSNGCNASQSVTLTSPSPLVATSTSSQILCNGDNATVNISALGGTSPYLGTGNYTVTAGNYSYTVTDANGCSATTNITVAEPTLLTATSTATTILCNGGNSTVSVSGNGGTAPYSGTGNYSVTAGNYSYMVMDANGCSATTSISVSQPSLVTVTASSDVTVYSGYSPMSCTSLTAISNTGGTGTINLNWSNGTSGSLNTVCPNTTTNYTVTATDDNGCAATDEVNVCVVNVVCFAGRSNQGKIEICHNGNSICVSPDAVAAHLTHGCTLGSCSEINSCNASARNEKSTFLDETSSIILFPNPANLALTIEFDTHESKKSTYYIITNTVGQIVAEGAIESGNNTIDISKFENGLYFFRTVGEIITSKMFIKE